MPISYRYPGIQPFKTSDKDFFSGRKKDIENLFNAILLNQFTVIVGPSGVGKSSLLNAGILPKIEGEVNRKEGEKRKFWLFHVQVGNQNESENRSLVEKITGVPVKGLLPSANGQLNFKEKKEFLAFLPSILKSSLWYKFKQLQYSSLINGKKNIYLFLFDQLEELFTYPYDQFKTLMEELSQLVSPNTPEAVRSQILEMEDQKEDILEENERKTLETAIPIKFVFAIRSDKLSLLIRLREALSTILQNAYELRPLSPEQAREAILEPLTKPLKDAIDFTFHPEAVEHIIRYLQDRPNTNSDLVFDERRIEPFALQMICHHIEQNLQKLDEDSDRIITKNEVQDLDEIIEDFYLASLEKMDLDSKTGIVVRKFLEEIMIDERYRRKKCEIKEDITDKYEIPVPVLQKMVEARLLRQIVASDKVIMYEISHDCLIDPILNAKRSRLNLESTEKSEKIDDTVARLEREAEKSPNDYSIVKRLGDYYYLIQDYNNAIVKYSKAQRIKEQLNIPLGDLDLYFNRGDCYIKLNQYALAIKDLEEVLRMEPRHLNANYSIAFCHQMLYNDVTAKSYYLEVIKIDPTYTNAFYNLGLVCMYLKQFEESYDYFARTIELNRNDYEAYYWLGVLTAMNGEKQQEAIGFLKTSIAIKPDYSNSYLQLATIYQNLGESKNSIAILSELIEHDPNNKIAWNGLGYFHRMQKNYPESVKSYLKYLTLEPQDPEAYYNLVIVSNDLGKYKDAIQYAEKCLEFKPNYINAYLEKGFAHRMLQQIPESIACYNKVLELDPKNETASRNQQMINQYEESEKDLLQAIEKDPADVTALVELGTLANNKQKFTDAIGYFTRVLTLKPADTQAWLELAYAYYQLQEDGKAIEAYEKIISLDPGHHAAHASLGKLYDSLQNYEKAIQYFTRAVNLDPSDHDSFYRLGLIANTEKRYMDAVSYFDKALELKPDHTNALIEKGYALYNSEQFKMAMDCYEQICLYEPANSKAYYGLGLTHNKLNNPEASTKNFLKAIELNPSYYEPFYALATIPYANKNFDEAIPYFERCIALRPGEPANYDYVGYCYMQVKDHEKAALYYRKLVELEPQKGDSHFNLGLALKEMKSLEEALVYFKNAVSLKQDDAEALYYLGQTYEELNNLSEATRFYQQAAAIDPVYAAFATKANSLMT